MLIGSQKRLGYGYTDMPITRDSYLTHFSQ